MQSGIEVEILKPEELGSEERSAWARFVAASPHLSSPYFDLRYTLAAGRIAPNAAVAVLHRRGVIEGFLPFQRRGGRLQPLGAPVTDYHGPIAAPAFRTDLASTVQALGGDHFCFSGYLGEEPLGASRSAGRCAMVADLSGGFDAYLAARQGAHGGFFKDKRRRARSLERDLGPLSFTLGRGDARTLDWLLALKREQMRRTAQHDVFACGWTEDLLRALLEHDEPDFGARLAVLRAGDRVVAAEVGLRAGGVHHLWFPVYDPELARYSPGALMTVETLRAVAGQGVVSVDFGLEGESYKSSLADPAGTAFEGVAAARPLRRAASRMIDRLASFAPARLGGVHVRLARRLDRIIACHADTSQLLKYGALSLAALALASASVPVHPPGSGARTRTGPSLSQGRL